MRWSAAFIFAFVLLFGTQARADNACPGGSYSTVTSPDGTSLSILFDNFTVASADMTGGVARLICNIQVDLNLPDGFTLGVNKVDYRGFARLARRQSVQLSVDYSLGPRTNRRAYRRSIKGVFDSDFLFTERVGAAGMRRVGCGVDDVLNIAITLELESNSAEEGMAALDSVDSAPKGGLVYEFDLKRCR